MGEETSDIRPCHTAAILSRETKRALFYHAKPRSGIHEGEAWRGETKHFWSPGTMWLPCDKGEWVKTHRVEDVGNKIISIDLTNVDVMIARYLSGNRALLSVCSDK